MTDFAQARQAMVDSQIKVCDVTDDRVLEAIKSVPREEFVPKPKRSIAYIDRPIELSSRRYLMPPVIFARMLQAAEIVQSDVALDIGCATGYSTAVLAKLCETVVALEEDEGLANGATETLSRLEIQNAAVVTGPLAVGYAGQGPYDVVFVNGAVETLPQEILEQLNDGGRLVVVQGTERLGRAVLYRKNGELTPHRALFDAIIPQLPGFEIAQTFTL